MTERNETDFEVPAADDRNPAAADGNRSRVTRAAVIGAGLIGLSWARLFATYGIEVAIADPRPDLEATVAQLRESLDAQTADILVAQSVGEALRGAGFVQESGPERPELKAQLFADLAEAAEPDAILASSSSAIPASQIAARLDDDAAGRVIIGHPFNPPHLMPLVEVVPGERTSPDTVAAAMRFYVSLDREPVALAKEMRGFIGNRLQNAVLREASFLVQQGVATVADVDRAVRASLGIRWTAIGPLGGMHVGGGDAGLRGFMEHIGPSFAAIEPATPDMSDAGMEVVYGQAQAAYGLPPHSEVLAERDRVQRGVLQVLAEEAPPAADETEVQGVSDGRPAGTSAPEEGERSADQQDADEVLDAAGNTAPRDNADDSGDSAESSSLSSEA